MGQFLFPLILIIASVGLFLGYTNPVYQGGATSGTAIENLDIKGLQSLKTDYETALVNSKKLQAKRDDLTAKYNQFDPADLIKIQKLLPDNVDNIRLIIDIEDIANKYGMPLKNPKYSSSVKADDKAQPAQPQQVTAQAPKEYGSFDLEFTVTGTYDNFLKFLDDVEHSLRIVDIKSVVFSPRDGSTAYDYTVKINTYWLKN